MKIAMLGLKGIPCPAGVENVVEELGSRLVARGHEVTVYVRSHYTPREMVEYRGMRLVHLPSIPTKNLDAITHSFLSTLAALKDKPDIAHIHATGNSIFAALPRLWNIPTVVQSHGLDWQRAKWGKFAKTYLHLTDYTTVNFPSAATAVSQKLQKYYQERYHRPVIYIPNGVNPVERAKPNEIHSLSLHGNDYILFAARLVPEKGCHYLINAFNRLEGCSKKLVIAGDANYGDLYSENLKKQASERILFLGFVRGSLLQELLSNAYLYVLPSEIEGLSTGLLEAMSYGNCVMVSNIDENLEAVGDNGFTFQSRDEESLREKLQYLIDHEEIIDEYRVQARQYVQNKYNWDEVTDQYEALYYSLLNDKKAIGIAETRSNNDVLDVLG